MFDVARLKRTLPYAVVAAGAGYLYHVAANIQYHARSGVLGPDFWPKAILALTLVVCAYKIAAALVVEGSPVTGSDAEQTVSEQSRPWLVVGGMALSAFYVGTITTLGFFSATVLYLAAFIALGGYRRWGVVAAVSVVGALLLLFFFMKVVYVSLPLGKGPFLEVTLALMKLMGIR